MRKWLLAGLVALPAILLIATTWKMFQFRDRLHDLISNPRWEQRLADQGAYDSGTIVFFGDSQLALWRMAPSFGSLPIRNRGLPGDYASRAVRRFERDALDLNPSLIVMLIGTNDLTAQTDPDGIAGHIEQMIRMAREQEAAVALCSLLPVRGPFAESRPPELIRAVNRQLQELAEQYQATYVDFHASLAGDDGLMRDVHTTDGLHASDSGYAVMTGILYPVLMSHLIGQSPTAR